MITFDKGNEYLDHLSSFVCSLFKALTYEEFLNTLSDLYAPPLENFIEQIDYLNGTHYLYYLMLLLKNFALPKILPIKKIYDDILEWDVNNVI